ncbi:hypothetical protein GQ457_11G000080 [Hibiscus cannabinus]
MNSSPFQGLGGNLDTLKAFYPKLEGNPLLQREKRKANKKFPLRLAERVKGSLAAACFAFLPALFPPTLDSSFSRFEQKTYS